MVRTPLVLAGLACLAIPVAGFAHSDDPKIFDLLPRYEGEGWSAALDGAPPVDFPAAGVQLMSWLPLGEFGNFANANDCWGYTSPSGREYAILGLSGGTGFVEITNPSMPQIIAVHPGPTSLWRGVKTYQEFAYAVSEGGDGIQVFDMSNIDGGEVLHTSTVTIGGNLATHTVAVDPVSGFLYRAGGGSNGLRMYSLADPANPQFVGQWPTKYVHEAQVYTYTSGPYAGRQIAFCCGGFNNGSVETGLSIVDVTDKSAPVVVGEVQYDAARYCHQGWLTEDEQYFIINDELDEQQNGTLTTTHVINVADLENPFEAGTFSNGSTAIDHNCYVKGDHLYAANYRSGLRVFDISELPAATEIASFDTFPENDNANFNGLWSCYPFFASGTVIGSDIEKGLFVWTVGATKLDIDFPAGVPDLLSPGGQALTVRITAAEGEQYAAGSALLHFTVSGGSPDAEQQAALIPAGGDIFTAMIPPLPCGEEVEFFISAETVSGATVYEPGAALTTGGLVRTVATAVEVGFEDNMESPTGWAAGAPGDTASSGIWVNADPAGTAAQPEDDNPSGEGTKCWITGNSAFGSGDGANDVDGGITTLTSPVLDAAGASGGGDPVFISYWRWYSNNAGGAPNADVMPVLISNNGGFSYVPLESVTENTGEWTYRQFRINDFVAPTAAMRLRFIAQDLGEGSLVEAGVDDVRIFAYVCESGLVGDLDGDCLVGSSDLNVLLGLFGGATSPATGPDFTGDGLVGSADLNVLLGAFGQVCGG